MTRAGTTGSKQIGRWSDDGVTVTFRHRRSGDLRTVYEPGQSRREALRAACAHFDPVEWCVQTVSTPQTIYNDLKHSRKLIDPIDDWRGRVKHGPHARQIMAYSQGGVQLPETGMVAPAGLRAYL